MSWPTLLNELSLLRAQCMFVRYIPCVASEVTRHGKKQSHKTAATLPFRLKKQQQRFKRVIEPLKRVSGYAGLQQILRHEVTKMTNETKLTGLAKMPFPFLRVNDSGRMRETERTRFSRRSNYPVFVSSKRRVDKTGALSEV